ncbi:MAG TPA: DUF4349 domain-containing protein [Longimicrobiaceae bacterium]|nr:DUF4349 domain-containing protein [Longimicrobiaceae bacterium]
MIPAFRRFASRGLVFLLLATLSWACSGGGGNEAAAPSEEVAQATADDAVGYTGSLKEAKPAEPPSSSQAQPPLPDTEPAPPDTTGQPSGSTPATLMIIRTGQAVVKVASLETGIQRVRQLAQGLNGFVANTSVQSAEGEDRIATLELKIPAAGFDRAVSGLRPIGRVESVNVTAEDVGEEFVDVSARVANARRLEDRLNTLLATRTGNLEQVLSVERELARVREEIERYEGRLRYLRARTSLSTLTVMLHEGNTPSRIGNAFGDAWDNFVNFLAGFIASLGVLVPLLVLLVLFLWGLVRLLRFLRRGGPPRRGPDPPAAPPPPPAA